MTWKVNVGGAGNRARTHCQCSQSHHAWYSCQPAAFLIPASRGRSKESVRLPSTAQSPLGTVTGAPPALLPCAEKGKSRLSSVQDLT